MRTLKKQRTSLIILLSLSMMMHLVYGIEGAAQVDAYEQKIERQAAIIQDREEQIEVLEIILEHQEEPVAKETFAGEFTVTYYCSCTECCGKTDGITASGTFAQEGITVAADWTMLSPGTEIFIEGIGFRTVEDKGGAIKGNRLDVFMDSHAAALEAGIGQADVWVVEDANEI
jgi:3D (Asp-Asp-Asp) domain-containing protein